MQRDIACLWEFPYSIYFSILFIDFSDNKCYTEVLYTTSPILIDLQTYGLPYWYRLIKVWIHMFILNILFPFKTSRTLMKKQYYIYAIGLENNDNYMNITGWGWGVWRSCLENYVFVQRKKYLDFQVKGPVVLLP